MDVPRPMPADGILPLVRQHRPERLLWHSAVGVPFRRCHPRRDRVLLLPLRGVSHDRWRVGPGIFRPRMQCPSCHLPLKPEIVDGQPFERCRRCGGEYFSHRALQELLSAHAGPAGATGASYRRPSPPADPVRYRKCPSCGEPMLRRNFRESSGIVVDVCAAHGVWLDQGELASLTEFAATGAEAERRSAERAETTRRLE